MFCKRTLVNEQQHRHAEHRPPDGDHQKRRSHRLGLVGEPEGAGIEDHQHIDRKKQPTAEIAERKAERGYALQLGTFSDIEQHRIVGDIAAGETDHTQYIQQRRNQPMSLADQKQPTAHQRAEHREHQQQALLAAAVIGEHTQDRRQQHHQ